MKCPVEGKVALDDTTATIVRFDAEQVEELLANGDLVLLLGINSKGEILVFQSPRSPFEEAPSELEKGAAFFANASISGTYCGCRNGRKYYRFGGICCRSAEPC